MCTCAATSDRTYSHAAAYISWSWRACAKRSSLEPQLVHMYHGACMRALEPLCVQMLCTHRFCTCTTCAFVTGAARALLADECAELSAESFHAWNKLRHWRSWARARGVHARTMYYVLCMYYVCTGGVFHDLRICMHVNSTCGTSTWVLILINIRYLRLRTFGALPNSLFGFLLAVTQLAEAASAKETFFFELQVENWCSQQFFFISTQMLCFSFNQL